MKTLLSIILLLIITTVLLFFAKTGDKLKTKTVYIIFGSMVFLGFLIRLLTVILVPCEPISDYHTMFAAGESLANGGLPFTMGSYFQRFPHMTTFSALCGLLMKIFGKNVFIIKIFSVLFKTVAVFSAGLIGRELMSKRGMLCTAFLYAIFLPDIFYTPVVASENFALTFILYSLYFFIKAFKSENLKNTIRNMLFCGLLLSFGCLLRGVAPFYLAAFSAGILFCFKTIKKRFVSFAALFLSFILLFQAVSLSLYWGGITEYKLSDKGEPYIVYILVGSNFETNGMYSSEDHGVYLDAGENPEKASEIAKEKLFKRLSENPEKIFPLLIKKTDIIWSDASFNSVYWSMVENGCEEDNSFYPLAQTMCKTMYYLLLFLSLLFIIFYTQRRITCMLILLPLAFEGGLMLMEIQPRYTFSVAYIFTTFAAVGVCAAVNYFNKKSGDNNV